LKAFQESTKVNHEGTETVRLYEQRGLTQNASAEQQQMSRGVDGRRGSLGFGE
jgi:predicted DNA-binding protein (UPF0251 family)